MGLKKGNQIRKGKHDSEETKIKKSLSHKGNKNFMFGKSGVWLNKKRPEHSQFMKRLQISKRPEVREKISESHKKLFIEGKRNIDGKNNPAYIHGESRRLYNKYFHQIRKSILERDEYICQLCGDKLIDKRTKDKKWASVHHINYNKNNNIASNLITLCNFCNISVNKNREDWTKFFQEKNGFKTIW